MGRNDMKKIIIEVDDKWTVILFVNVDYDRYDIIESALTDILAPIHIIDEIYDKVSYAFNSGFTYSNPYYRVSVVGINKTTSRAELMDTVTHEIDHVQSDICNYYDIDLDSEPAAYLIGHLARSFYRACYNCFCNY